MARHRTYPIAFKRQLAQEFLAGGMSLHGLARRHDVCRNLIRIWVEKYERGEFNDEAEAANLIKLYEARIAARADGRASGARERAAKGGVSRLASNERRDALRRHRPRGLSVAQGCRVMGLPRSSYYRDSRTVVDDTALVERMCVLADDWPHYGYRRMAAQLRAEGLPVNRKRVARLMRLHDLCVRPRRRYVVTTDSDHDGPIFPNLAKTMAPDGPDQLWVADITYIGLTSGTFVYLAIVLDAWSRRVVGYALGRVIDARLTMAALQTAIVTRRPPTGCVHHSDRGGRGGFNWSSQHRGGGRCDGGSATFGSEATG